MPDIFSFNTDFGYQFQATGVGGPSHEKLVLGRSIIIDTLIDEGRGPSDGTQQCDTEIRYSITYTLRRYPFL